MADGQAEKLKVEQAIRKYVEVLKQSSADLLPSLFTDDGVLMAADAPTIVGTKQLNNFFNHGFSAVKLDAVLEFDEVVVIESFAYVRTHSRVSVTVLQTDIAHTEHNRELFLLRKNAGDWKISRYMFNKIPA